MRRAGEEGKLVRVVPEVSGDHVWVGCPELVEVVGREVAQGRDPQWSEANAAPLR